MASRSPIQADGQCTSRFAGCRCDLRAGHAGPHYHDGHKGTFGWGGQKRKRFYPGGRPPVVGQSEGSSSATSNQQEPT